MEPLNDIDRHNIVSDYRLAATDLERRGLDTDAEELRYWAILYDPFPVALDIPITVEWSWRDRLLNWFKGLFEGFETI